MKFNPGEYRYPSRRSVVYGHKGMVATAFANRLHNFNYDYNHDNCLMPHKKTYHTIIPGFLMKNGKAVGPFGVMGGFMQPQGHVQVISNLIDFHCGGTEPRADGHVAVW